MTMYLSLTWQNMTTVQLKTVRLELQWVILKYLIVISMQLEDFPSHCMETILTGL